MSTSFASNWDDGLSVRRTSSLRSNRCRCSGILLCEILSRRAGRQPNGELSDLSAITLRSIRLFAAWNRVVEDVEAVGNGRERIAQLVRKHAMN